MSRAPSGSSSTTSPPTGPLLPPHSLLPAPIFFFLIVSPDPLADSSLGEVCSVRGWGVGSGTVSDRCPRQWSCGVWSTGCVLLRCICADVRHQHLFTCDIGCAHCCVALCCGLGDFQSVQGTISTQNTCHAQDQPKTRDPEPRHRIRPKPNHQTYLCPTSETLNPRCKRLKRGSGEQVSEELLQHKLKTFVEEADMEQAMSGALLPRPPPLAARLPSFSVCTSRVPCVLWPVCVTSDLWAAGADGRRERAEGGRVPAAPRAVEAVRPRAPHQRWRLQALHRRPLSLTQPLSARFSAL
eukprot:590961-Rhodomonas_salina.1